MTLDDLDLASAQAWADRDRAIEQGGLWLSDGKKFHGLVNEHAEPGKFFSTGAEIPRAKYSAFFHSHPGGSLPSKTDMEALEYFEEWFGIEHGVVLGFREDCLSWWLYNKNEILESKHEYVSTNVR